MDLSGFQLFFELFECSLYYGEEYGVIYQEWHSTAYGERYRTVLLEILKFQKEHVVSKLIVNGKELGELDEEDIQWTQNDYSPMSVEGGLKFIAFVVSDDDYHAMQQADVIYEAENAGVTSKHFNDAEEAFSWIKDK